MDAARSLQQTPPASQLPTRCALCLVPCIGYAAAQSRRREEVPESFVQGISTQRFLRPGSVKIVYSRRGAVARFRPTPCLLLGGDVQTATAKACGDGQEYHVHCGMHPHSALGHSKY